MVIDSRTLKLASSCLLLLFPLYFLFHGLAAFGLLNNVEGMYAEIAREMLAGGHWIIPHLNDVPYIEKPPLLYWLAASTMSVFGVHDWVVRLVPACAGLLLLAIVGWFGWRTRGRRFALLSVFMLGSSFGFVVMSRVALTDALLSALLNAALLLTWFGLTKRSKATLRVASILLALAILTKGFVALALYGLVGIAWLLFCRRQDWYATLKQLFEPWAVALFLLVLLPWHIAAALSLPEFSWFYFVNEHLYRFLGIREPRDYYSGSVFYYLPRLALMSLPWLPLIALLPFLRNKDSAQSDGLNGFLICCVLAPLIFFSLSSAKANYYVIVCVPGLALLAAAALDRWIVLKPQRARYVLIGLLLIGIALVPAERYATQFAAGGETEFSARKMAKVILFERAAGVDLPLFVYQDFEDYSSLPFYLQSTVGIIDSRSDDLRFGQRLGAGREHFLTVEEFMTRPDRQRPAWLVVHDPRQPDFQTTPLAKVSVPMLKIGRATLYRISVTN